MLFRSQHPVVPHLVHTRRRDDRRQLLHELERREVDRGLGWHQAPDAWVERTWPQAAADLLGSMAKVSYYNAQAQKIPVVAPSGLRIVNAGAAFGTDDVRRLIEEFGAIGVAEVMNYPAVINGDPMFRDIIATAGWRRVDGHAPGLRGNQLDAYIAAGVESDHETFTPAEAHEKRQKGMWVFLRQGSVCQDLVELLPSVLNHGPMGSSFCTDDREPDLLRDEGHLNHCIRLAVGAGLDVISAFSVASYFPAMYHNFFHLGQLGPGYQADVVVFDELDTFTPRIVLQKGRVVAREEIGRAHV